MIIMLKMLLYWWYFYISMSTSNSLSVWFTNLLECEFSDVKAYVHMDTYFSMRTLSLSLSHTHTHTHCMFYMIERKSITDLFTLFFEFIFICLTWAISRLLWSAQKLNKFWWMQTNTNLFIKRCKSRLVKLLSLLYLSC